MTVFIFIFNLSRVLDDGFLGISFGLLLSLRLGQIQVRIWCMHACIWCNTHINKHEVLCFVLVYTAEVSWCCTCK